MKKAVIICMMLVSFIVTSCESRQLSAFNKYRVVSPDELFSTNGSVEIDFKELHNDVIDGMLTMQDIFFFIDENGFVVSGTNNPKQIEIELTCTDGATKNDVQLVFSMALNLIGFYCAQQNFKYEAPTLGDDNSYKDFGTVFNDYALRLYAKDTSGKAIIDENIKPGAKIPIDPQYIMEE